MPGCSAMAAWHSTTCLQGLHRRRLAEPPFTAPKPHPCDTLSGPRWVRDAPCRQHFNAARRPLAASAAPGADALGSAAADLHTDVCIVGAGIIGLFAAMELLQRDPALRVVLVDRQVPCAGATGAGQGYIWLAHRAAGTPLWAAAARSIQLWRSLLGAGALDPADVEWQPLGSLLLAGSEEESASLRDREAQLQAAGLHASWLPAAKLAELEPALSVGQEASGLLLPSDAQINGRQAAAALLAACRAHSGRFTPLFQEPVLALLRSTGGGGVEGVQTAARRVHASRGVVLAAGAWSAGLLAQELGDERWGRAILPRRGMLLEMPRRGGMPPLRTGMMEVGYTKHYANTNSTSMSGNGSSGGSSSWQSSQGSSRTASGSGSGRGPDITFTATTSASGSLLIGSSREFAGWDTRADAAVVENVLLRARSFLPALAAVRHQDVGVRVGLRPYAAGGAPMVGPVPGCPGLLVAAGHEGSGLTLGPATAELLADYILGRPPAAGEAVARALTCTAPR